MAKKRARPTKKDLVIRRAVFVYNACRLAAAAARAPVIPPPLPNRGEEFVKRFVAAIDKQCGPQRVTSPKALHEQWLDMYFKMGWKYGPTYDPEKKTHPDLVAYEQLDPLERDKDEVFFIMCDVARRFIR